MKNVITFFNISVEKKTSVLLSYNNYYLYILQVCQVWCTWFDGFFCYSSLRNFAGHITEYFLLKTGDRIGFF